MHTHMWIARLAILLALAVSGTAGQAAAATPPMQTDSQSVTIKLNELKGSGDSGTAVLTAMGANQVRVVIQMGGAMPMEHNHPVHIHKGTCAALDPVPAYPLNAVATGHSDTTVPVSLAALMSGSYAINLHESPAAITTYTACGDITTMNSIVAPAGGTAAAKGTGSMAGSSSGTMPPTGQGSGVPPWLTWAGLAGLALLTGGLLRRQGRASHRTPQLQRIHEA